MDNDTLKKRLGALLQRATLREGEEADDARVNEARTCAFMLLQLVQKHGVKLKFVIQVERPAPPPPPMPDPMRTATPDEFFERIQRERAQREADDAIRRAKAIRDLEDLVRGKRPKSARAVDFADGASLEDILFGDDFKADRFRHTYAAPPSAAHVQHPPSEDELLGVRLVRLKFAARCPKCGKALGPGDEGYFAAGDVLCASHGKAGAVHYAKTGR